MSQGCGRTLGPTRAPRPASRPSRLLLACLGLLSGFLIMPAVARAQPASPTNGQPAPAQPSSAPIAIRVATFNIEDVRTEDLANPRQPRVRALAEIIQRLHPNIILLNEIAWDPPPPGPPGPDGRPTASTEPGGLNAQRFVDNFLSRPLIDGLDPVRYRVYMGPTNTGMASGHDLDNDGAVTTTYPTPAGARSDGAPGEQTDAGRAFGNDCWGFGTFPGQYAMALLVDERLEIARDQIRTFRLLPWDYMPNNLMPMDPVTGAPWFDDTETPVFRLSSKSHWDVPVVLPGGVTLHVLCSHPTPPAFDGPEKRNVRRNHDEVRFWADYVEDASYIVDDQGRMGGLRNGTPFVILGDLNCDPDESPEVGNALRDIVLASPRVNPSFTPTSEVPVRGDDGPIDPTDTASWGKRADHVIPAARIRVMQGGIWRYKPTLYSRFPSDHFPVWADLAVPRE